MSNSRLVLLQVGENQLPVGRGQPPIHAAVELLGHERLVRIADVDRPARGQREQVAARIRRLQRDHVSILVEADAVDDGEAAAGVRIAGHERLGQEIQRRAVDDHPRPADGVDHRPAGGIAHDVALAALGPVEERLPDVAVDDQLAALGDLAELVLGVAVHVGLQPVHARGEVVAGVVVAVHAQAVGGGPKPAAWKRVPRVL